MSTASISNARQELGLQKLKHIDTATRICAVVIVLLVVLTAVLIGVSQAGYIHPAAPIGSFAGLIPPAFIILALDCCRKPIAERHGLNLDAIEKVQREERQRKRASEEDSSSEASSSVST